MQRDTTLPSGREVRIKAPGSEARKVIQAAFSAAEWKQLVATAPGGDLSQLRQSELSQEMYARWLDANVSYVCACTVEPRLWPTYPAPARAVYYDDLDPKDWDALQLAVGELSQEKKSDSTG